MCDVDEQEPSKTSTNHQSEQGLISATQPGTLSKTPLTMNGESSKPAFTNQHGRDPVPEATGNTAILAQDKDVSGHGLLQGLVLLQHV